MKPEDIQKLSSDQLTQLIIKYKFYEGDVKALTLPQKRTRDFVFTKKDGNTQKQRTQSQPNVTQVKRHNQNYEPRDRRLSEPNTQVEKAKAVQHTRLNQIKQSQESKMKEELQKKMPQYDKLGCYPAVKRLVCIGDVHGDLKVSLTALKLAE